MADIYGRAYVTLCATSSASDDNGCLLATPELLSPHRIPCKSRNGTEYEVCVRGWPELQHISSWETQTIKGTDAAATKTRKTRLDFPFLEDFSSLNDFPSRSDFPLLTRAWCFQERLLSPRLLHFTKGEIMWECGELSTCECDSNCNNNGVKPQFLRDRRFKEKYKQLFACHDCEDSPLAEICCGCGFTKHEHELVRLWHEIVQHYSQLDLTFGQDRLPALSGVAKQMMQLRPGDVYLAGLWRNTLLLDLAWFVTNRVTRPLDCLGPSWSWSAVEDQVTFACPITRDTLFDDCVILEAAVTPVGSDPAGKVIAGHIILSAPLFEARFEVWQHNEDAERIEFTLEGNGYRTDFALDCISDYDTGKLKCCDVLTGVRLWVSEMSRDFYLVLAPVEAGPDGLATYRRVGHVWQPGEYIKENWYPQGLKPRVLKII